MNNEFREAFGPIRATDEMKRNTLAFLRQESLKRQRKVRAPLRYAVACCAAMVLTVCGISGYHFYTTPVSYISVDVNPSVELGLNPLDRVVTVESYNDDGVQVLENVVLKNKSYTQAVELLLADEIFESYLAQDALLSFTVVSDKEERLLAGIQQCNGYAQNAAECYGASANLRDEAHSSGLSLGKYRAFLELSQYDSSMTAEDCKGLTMRQIRDQIAFYSGDPEDALMGQGQGNGNGYGKCAGNGPYTDPAQCPNFGNGLCYSNE